MLWLLRWGQKQNVAAEQKVVTQRQQTAAQQQGAVAGGSSDTHPDTPTSPNGFTAAEAHPQVGLTNQLSRVYLLIRRPCSCLMLRNRCCLQLVLHWFLT